VLFGRELLLRRGGQTLLARTCAFSRQRDEMAGWEMMTFNIKDGYLEAIVRGYKSGLLAAADYNNLCQCESLDDIKLNLTGTDYGGFLQNGTSP